MFDLISGGPRHPFHQPTIVPTIASIAGHGVVLLALTAASYAVTRDLPDLPDMLAFVAAAPAPAPQPPPPPPARRAAAAKTEPLNASRSGAPVEAPSSIIQESSIPADEDE